ncbi:MAG TPA: cell division protein ZapB [Bryobacteraceae bacterium]|nr:cell division protein ZapB [Bryobacteraceae bacterium]
MRTEVPIPDARPLAVPALILAISYAVCTPALQAQAPADLQQVLERLDRLEQQNRALVEEVRALRQQLSEARTPEPNAPLEERVAIQETRGAELAQTKVETSQRFPLRITGMALFNTFLNTRTEGDGQYPTLASATGARSAGAGFRQTTIGLEYRGPATFSGGKVRGSVFMDFFGGSGRVLDQAMRLRTAVLGIDWSTRSIEGGLEKPLIAPRDPDSLAQVGVSPLSGAGNLWLWIPQVRFEQRLPFAGGTLRAQVAAVQTSEGLPDYEASAYEPAYEGRRPGVEGRLEFARGEGRRIEIAPAFHRSTSHVTGHSIPSDVYSFDWLVRPLAALDLKGALFTGQNVAPLGTGGYRQGYTLYGRWNKARAVRARGGWAQLTVRATSRLAFHVFSGAEDDRDSDLPAGGIGRNVVYGANFFYRLAPNVLASFETTQTRTSYVGGNPLLNNHYDLALAYLF